MNDNFSRCYFIASIFISKSFPFFLLTKDTRCRLPPYHVLKRGFFKRGNRKMATLADGLRSLNVLNVS